MIFILVPRRSQKFRKGRHGECDRDYSNVNCSRWWCPVCIIIVMSTMWRLQGSWMVQTGPISHRWLLTSYCLLIMGTALSALGPAPVMRALHANRPQLCRYLDPGYITAMITVGSRYPGGWIIRPTHRALFGWFCTFSIGIQDLDWFLKPNISKYPHTIYQTGWLEHSKRD